MPSPATLMSLLATSLIAYSDASPVAPRWKQPASESCGASAVGKALYLQTNEKCNNLVSIPIGLDGTLWGGSMIETGGSGGDQINAMTGMGDAPDALASQGAVHQVGDYVFVVNAGSNTVSQFKISNTNATSLMQVGKPAQIPGEFPVSVAASQKLNLTCVGYTGAKAGVACAPYSSWGIGEFKEVADFADINQTTPPQGPTNGVAWVSFAANDTRLLTTVKGDGMNKTGYVSVLPLGKSNKKPIAGKETRSSPNGTAVLFGGVSIPETSDLFVTDASFGAALLNLNSMSDMVSLKEKQVVKGQMATCWAAYSAARESVFVTDAAVNRIIEFSQDGEKVLSTLDLKNSDPGLTEIQVSGRFVYALSPGNGTTPAAITVVDSFKGRQIQHFSLEKLGVGKLAQGLALLN